MSNQLALLHEATVRQHCKMLRMPMMGSQFSSLAEQAVRENKNHGSLLQWSNCTLRKKSRLLTLEGWNLTPLSPERSP